MKKNNNTKDNFRNKLAVIFKDINAIEIESTDSFRTSLDKFYSVMRKHGIKQGTWTKGGGVTLCNPEWSMCYDVFKAHKVLSLDIWIQLTESIPDDLRAYGKKPALSSNKPKKKPEKKIHNKTVSDIKRLLNNNIEFKLTKYYPKYKKWFFGCKWSDAIVDKHPSNSDTQVRMFARGLRVLGYYTIENFVKEYNNGWWERIN